MSASGWGTCLKFHFLVRICQKDKLSTSSKTFPKNFFVVADSIFCKPKHKVNIIYHYNYRKALSSLIFIKDISLIKQKLLELGKHWKHTMIVPNVTGSTEYSTECFALWCWETKGIQDLSLNPGWLILSGLWVFQVTALTLIDVSSRVAWRRSFSLSSWLRVSGPREPW